MTGKKTKQNKTQKQNKIQKKLYMADIICNEYIGHTGPTQR